jgi:hypothetical protein
LQRWLLVALVSVGVIVAACSTTSLPGETSPAKPELPGAAAVERFAGLLTAAVDVDYTPLASPADAVETADLIVVGRIVKVSEGLRIATKGEQGAVALWLATMTVSVDEIIAGTGDGRAEITIQTFTDPGMDVETLARAVPDGPVLLVLDDLTDWRPFTDAVFEYPTGLTADTRMFMPFSDGMWFDTSDGLRGVAVSATEIAQRWPGADTFPAMVTLLRGAAEAQTGS